MLNQINIFLTNIYCQCSLISLSWIACRFQQLNLSTKSCCRIDHGACIYTCMCQQNSNSLSFLRKSTSIQEKKWSLLTYKTCQVNNEYILPFQHHNILTLLLLAPLILPCLVYTWLRRLVVPMSTASTNFSLLSAPSPVLSSTSAVGESIRSTFYSVET